MSYPSSSSLSLLASEESRAVGLASSRSTLRRGHGRIARGVPDDWIEEKAAGQPRCAIHIFVTVEGTRKPTRAVHRRLAAHATRLIITAKRSVKRALTIASARDSWPGTRPYPVAEHRVLRLPLVGVAPRPRGGIDMWAVVRGLAFAQHLAPVGGDRRGVVPTLRVGGAGNRATYRIIRWHLAVASRRTKLAESIAGLVTADATCAIPGAALATAPAARSETFPRCIRCPIRSSVHRRAVRIRAVRSRVASGPAAANAASISSATRTDATAAVNTATSASGASASTAAGWAASGRAPSDASAADRPTSIRG